MTITDMRILFGDVHIDGKYCYVYSVFNECVELYKKSMISDNMVYVGDFDNTSDCVRYIETIRNIYKED